jgi:uncharacterized protein (DUF3820 family)
MDITLTITLEQEVAQTINDYAKSSGRDISDLVKNYFNLLIQKNYFDNIKVTPIANSLMGSLNPPDNGNYKQELEDALIEEYS